MLETHFSSCTRIRSNMSHQYEFRAKQRLRKERGPEMLTRTRRDSWRAMVLPLADGRGRQERTRPALFSLRLGDGIHLARERLSRFLIFSDEAREYPTVNQGDDLEFFILEACNHFFFQSRALDTPVAEA